MRLDQLIGVHDPAFKRGDGSLCGVDCHAILDSARFHAALFHLIDGSLPVLTFDFEPKNYLVGHYFTPDWSDQVRSDLLIKSNGF